MKRFILLLSIFSTTLFGRTLPPNDLWISPDVITTGDVTRLTKTEFDWAIKKISDAYVPIVNELGKELVIYSNWEDGTVNAYADRKGDEYQLHLFGGLARFKNLSADGFLMVICHELGHNIGGLPKYRSRFDNSHNWAVNEGQSDYFASLKCMRRVLVNDDNIAYVKTMKIDPYALAKCNETYKIDEDVALCSRIAMAAKSIAMVFRIVSGSEKEMRFEEASSKKVLSTKHSHPDAQCRLDTFFQAALCTENYESNVSEININQGVCVTGVGSRPRCWYKP